MYSDFLRGLTRVVRRKRLKKMENSWFLLQDNAPAHQPVLVNDFLAENNVTTLEHPPHSDLAPAALYLFPRLKSALKRRHFCDATDITKNATKELKRFSQHGFQLRFQHLYSR